MCINYELDFDNEELDIETVKELSDMEMFDTEDNQDREFSSWEV